MGFMDWVNSLPIVYTGSGLTGQVAVHKGQISRGSESYPLEGVAARVESGSALESRVTLTRLVALGVFAVAAQKKSGGESYLTIEGPAFFWSVEVDRKKHKEAVRFATQVNDAVRKASSPST